MTDLNAMTWKVIEEAAELQKVLATANQIGWDATHPSAKAPNYELAMHELDDLGGAVQDLMAALDEHRVAKITEKIKAETTGAPAAATPPQAASQAES